jgi:tRNA pseudouridine32 synthase/23S rRNA pseudouridine746 synthase
VTLPSLKTPPWATVLDFLHHRMPSVPHADWALRLALGRVLAENGEALAPNAAYVGGSRVYYYRDVPDEAPVPFAETVLFQDAHLVVADKPHFLPVTPGGRYVRQTLLVRLQQRLGLPQLAPLHRIDRETAGLVLFAVNPNERGVYHALFSERTMHKTYEAIAPHRPEMNFPSTRCSRIEEDPAHFFRMLETSGAHNSETRIEQNEVCGVWARYTLSPVTGKRHQLRVHMDAIGAPIRGDQLYPHVLRGPDDAEDFSEPLQLLARGMAFTDPVTGKERRFESQQSLAWPEA